MKTRNNELVVNITRRLNSKDAFDKNILPNSGDSLQRLSLAWAYSSRKGEKSSACKRRLGLLHHYYLWDWASARRVWGVADGTLVGDTIYRVYLFTAVCMLNGQTHAFDFALLTYAKTTGVGSEIQLMESIKDAPVDLTPHVVRHFASLRRSLNKEQNSVCS